jgi:hypothetical protein
MDHSGFRNLGGWIDDTADDSRRIEVLTDQTAGIDALQLCSLPFTAITIEIPPGKTILGGKHCGIWAKQRSQAPGYARQAVSFERQYDHVDFTRCFWIIGSFDRDLKIANLAADAHAVFPHRAQVSAPSYQRHVFTGASQHGAEECANCSRAYDRESHDEVFSAVIAAATLRL